MSTATGRIKAFVPTPVWNAMRYAWQALARVRFWREYVDGVLFDLLDGEYRTDDLVFHVPRQHTKLAHRARFRRDTHELDERELVKRHIRPEAVVLELGACIGVVSCVINRRLADPRRQVSVEANPLLLDSLTANRDRNKAGFAIEHGLVSRRSDGSFYLSECFVMSSGEPIAGMHVQVPVLTVEELEHKHGLSFDALFMDIQGGEFDFLKENGDLLSRCNTVILELHPHIIGHDRCDECRRMLGQAGLEAVERRGLAEVWARSGS